jgi:hypothetical protein
MVWTPAGRYAVRAWILGAVICLGSIKEVTAPGDCGILAGFGWDSNAHWRACVASLFIDKILALVETKRNDA